jgi:hypothetical protein
MSRSYLALCKDIVADLGIAGGTLQSTQNLTNQELIRICNWVSRSDLYLQNLWTQWNFLWVQDIAITCAATSNSLLTSPPVWAADIQSYNLESLWINFGLATAQKIPWMEWNQFYKVYLSKPINTQLVPTYFSIDPAGNIWLSHNMPVLTTFAMEYYVVSNRMQLDTDTSPIPNNFDTIITERAKIIYAGRENAQEIMTSASAEYSDQLDKMQGYCLPDNLAGRTLRNDTTTVPQSYVD